MLGIHRIENPAAIPFERTREDLSWLEEIKQQLYEFDRALGQNTSSSELLSSAYHPVLNRSYLDRIRRFNLGIGVEQGWRHQNKRLIETLLAERFAVATTVDYLDVRGNKTYSTLFPEESLENIFAAGVEFRRRLGSTDFFREEAELRGWEIIRNRLTDRSTPIGARMISLSPPSEETGSPYSENYVDEFTKEVTEGGQTRIFRQRCRMRADFDFEGFARDINRSYFDHRGEEQTDVFMLAHPILTTREVPESAKAGMKAEDFEKILRTCEVFIESHLDQVFAGSVDWVGVAQSFNELLWRADLAVNLKPKERLIVSGTMPPELLAAARKAGGCGFTHGFELGKFGLDFLFKNSVGQFGVSERWEYKPGSCRVCKAPNAMVGPCSICRECEKQF